MKIKKTNLYKLTLVAVLGALSAVLMLVKIPLPFAPSFLKLDIAEFPGLFAGFFLGPMAGTGVVVLKNLINLLLSGTETMYVGELMNVVGSLGFMLPAALIYKYRKTTKGALLGLIVAVIVGNAFAIALNLFVAFPMYASVFGMPLEAIVEMGAVVNPLVKDMFTLIVFSVLPFNIIKLSLTAAVTWLLYKKLAKVLRRIIPAKKETTHEG